MNQSIVTIPTDIERQRVIENLKKPSVEGNEVVFFETPDADTLRECFFEGTFIYFAVFGSVELEQRPEIYRKLEIPRLTGRKIFKNNNGKIYKIEHYEPIWVGTSYESSEPRKKSWPFRFFHFLTPRKENQ